VRSQRKQGITLQQITTCQECGGHGSIIDTPCPECRGTGQIVNDEALTVRVPIGVEEGMALRVPGHGQPADKARMPPGDLFVVIRTADDPRFERHGRDLYRVETVDVVVEGSCGATPRRKAWQPQVPTAPCSLPSSSFYLI
jgi:molecular chaperone DnaJ